MTNLREIINALVALYPEQDKLINDLLNDALYLQYDVTDSADAITAIHTVRESLNALWVAVENENFDNRDLSDKDFGKVIAEIKKITAEIDLIIDGYRQDAISKFDLFIA